MHCTPEHLLLSLALLSTASCCFILIVLLLLFIFDLLLLSGDIEINPGPVAGKHINVIFTLMLYYVNGLSHSFNKGCSDAVYGPAHILLLCDIFN